MRTLERNKQSVTYKLYLGKSAITDDNGYKTGEFSINYGSATTIKAYVSPARGSADLDPFGTNENYSRTMIVSNPSCPIDENSILWVGVSTSASHNYCVTQVARSLNSVMYALKEVEVSG